MWFEDLWIEHGIVRLLYAFFPFSRTALPVQSVLQTTPTHPKGNPTLRRISQVGGAVNAVAVQGTFAYVGEGPRLVILDIARRPSRPEVLGRTEVLADVVQDVAVAGSYAYLALRRGAWAATVAGEQVYVVGDGGLLVLQVTPLTPTPIPTPTPTRTPTPTAPLTPTPTITAPEASILRLYLPFVGR